MNDHVTLAAALHRQMELLHALLGEKESEAQALQRVDAKALEAGRRAQETLLTALESAQGNALASLRAVWESQGMSGEPRDIESVIAALPPDEAIAVRATAARVRTLAQAVRNASATNILSAKRGLDGIQHALDAIVPRPRAEAGPIYDARGRTARSGARRESFRLA